MTNIIDYIPYYTILDDPSLVEYVWHISIKEARDKCKFVCNTCGSKFFNEDILKEHIKNHILEHALYRCNICNRICYSEATLRNHERTHSVKK